MCSRPGPSNAGTRVLHLRTRAQFQAVLAGSTVAKTAHFVMHRCGLADATPLSERTPLFQPSGVWVGAMLPKRWAKRSVTRHLIKRQVYAVAQDFALPQAAYVVRLRSGFDKQQFVSAHSKHLRLAVREEIQNLFAQIRGVDA